MRRNRKEEFRRNLMVDKVDAFISSVAHCPTAGPIIATDPVGGTPPPLPASPPPPLCPADTAATPPAITVAPTIVQTHHFLYQGGEGGSLCREIRSNAALSESESVAASFWGATATIATESGVKENPRKEMFPEGSVASI